jgi:hypothetical protein
VSHRKNAIPVGRRLVEKIFLAAFPVSAGRAFVWPLIENGFERRLCVEPATLLEK